MSVTAQNFIPSNYKAPPRNYEGSGGSTFKPTFQHSNQSESKMNANVSDFTPNPTAKPWMPPTTYQSYQAPVTRTWNHEEGWRPKTRN